VIEAFGQFVVGGNYIVGFVIFVALIAIQYLVVSHGAVRTAEVTARFTLDAMPGKQMAIDSDLNTGLITADQARQRREQVAREAEFCGSMDGAARFSQRDSLATILVLVINIVAGFLIGVFQMGIPFEQALKTYTILTVGNGLVSIIPSLLVSVAGGIVVTRAGSDFSLGADIEKQMFKTSRPLWIVSGVLLALALIPGMPKFAFVALGGTLMFIAWKMKPASAADAAAAKAAAAKGAARNAGGGPHGCGIEAGRSHAGGGRRPGAAGGCEARGPTAGG
jgi:flagellar biosynthesis protein FlhA